MTPAEMKAEAEAAILPLIASRQRSWVMREEELRTLLINAYCRGHRAATDKAVALFAPDRFEEYKKLSA